MAYPEVVKARMVRRMTGPEPQGLTHLAAETGIPTSTLSRWLKEAGKPVSKFQKTSPSKSFPTHLAGARRPQDITAVERAQFVVQAAALSGELRGSFLREHGLHEEQLQAWTRALETSVEAVPTTRKADTKRIRQLEKELGRKDKALAETAALLVLQKKAAMYFGVDEDDDTPKKIGR